MKSNQMKINSMKTVVITFDFTMRFDFVPNLTIESKQIEVLYRTKLLGVIVTSDGKFEENTKHLAARAKRRLFFLQRLKSLGADTEALTLVYKILIQSILARILCTTVGWIH